ncbi:MAG: translation initiation factor IF-1 [Mycoplasma sp.]|nr:translation initiation factor IF-1 [Mycoplasma sp.]
MAKDVIKMDGSVVKSYNSTEFDVKLTNGLIVRAKTSGKMQVHHIRILPGDQVQVELSPYDLTKGRITYRK